MKLFFDITLFLSLLATGVSLNTVSKDNGRELQSSLRAGSRRMEESCQSVKEIICSLGNTQTFCEMVTRFSQTYTTFADGLEGGIPYTVFAFTDEAFKTTEKEFLNLSPDEIYRTLLFHFYEDVVMTYEDLDCSTKLTSLTGDTSRTKCRRKSAGVYDKNQRGKGNKEIGDWPQIEANSKEACSGIIHRIDHVMLPILFKPFEALAIEVEPEDGDNSIFPNSEAELPEVEEELPEAEVTPAPTLPETEASTLPEVEVNDVKRDKEDIEDEIEEVKEDFVLQIGAKPEPSLANIDFDRENKLDFGSDGYVIGTQIEFTDISPEDIREVPVVEVKVEEEVKEGPKIGALGINLIIFSTLLLCFVFVCMRR